MSGFGRELAIMRNSRQVCQTECTLQNRVGECPVCASAAAVAVAAQQIPAAAGASNFRLAEAYPLTPRWADFGSLCHTQ